MRYGPACFEPEGLASGVNLAVQYQPAASRHDEYLKWIFPYAFHTFPSSVSHVFLIVCGTYHLIFIEITLYGSTPQCNHVSQVLCTPGSLHATSSIPSAFKSQSLLV